MDKAENTNDGADQRSLRRSETEQRIKSSRLRRWSKLAGARLSEMLMGRESTRRALEDADANIRAVAIDMLSLHWGEHRDEQLAVLAERLASGDPHPRVRASAVMALSRWYRLSDDVHIGLIFARIVHNGSEDAVVRETAYEGLLSLRGLLKFLTPLQTLRDIDWSFVDSFLVESRRPSPVDELHVAMPELSAAQARAFGLYNKGVEAFAHRDYEKSVEYLTEALGQEPTAAGGYLARGRANIELERTDEAIADLTRAIELNPSSLVALRERARAHRLRGAIDLAERDERIAAAIEKAKNPDRD